MSEFVFVEQKPERGKQHVPRPGATIGREDCDITIADPEISRRQAQLHREGDAVVIEDLGSTNGTFVNGERISGARRLEDGDEVRFGETVWRLQKAAAATPVAREIPTPPAAPEPPAEPEPSTEPQPALADRRGDVPPPDLQPSVIRRVVPPTSAPAPFDPGAGGQERGSAATRLSATVGATVAVALTAGGVVLYYVTEPFK
jgi:hypothetical protein